MDIRLKALRKTCGEIAVIAIAGILVSFVFSYLTTHQIVTVILLGIIALGANMIYKVNLEEYRRKEKIQEK